MRKTTKLIALILAVMMIVSCVPMFVSADAPTGTVVIGNATVEPSTENVVIPVTVTGTFCAMQLNVTYNTALELTAVGYGDDKNITSTFDYPNFAQGSVGLIIEAAGASERSSATFNLVFTAPEEEKTYNITYVNAQAATIAEELLDITGNDGFVKVVAPQGPVFNADLKFSSTACNFGSAYSIIYYIKDTRYNTWTDFSIRVEKDIYSGAEKTGTQIITLTDENKLPEKEGNYYKFELTGIAAKEVASKLVATIYATVNGVPSYGAENEYNLVDYAKSFVNDEEDVNYAKAMASFLNYAAENQVAFNYNTGNLANSSLTEEQKKIAEPTLADKLETVERIETQTAKTTGANMQFESQLVFLVYVDPLALNSDDLFVEFTWTDLYGTEHDDLVSLQGCAVEDGKIVVPYNCIPSNEMRTLFNFKVVDSSKTALSNTRQYSMESYAASQKDDAQFGKLVKSMIVFGDDLATFFANR